jgi:tight adherence protein C
MGHTAELVSMLVFAGVFLLVAVVGRSILVYLYGDQRRALARLQDLSAVPAAPAPDKPSRSSSILEIAATALPRVGSLVTPNDGERLARMKTRLTEAGIYGPNAVAILLGVQVLLAVLLPLAAALPCALGLLPWWYAISGTLVGVGVGILAPGMWVSHQRNKRQNELRRGLPDAIDMMVLCAEAGLGMSPALQRITAELQLVHPALARELNIILREVQLGLSVGDGLKKFGDRCGLAEVRDLAGVILQAERYGTSSVKALRLHSESCRLERQQRAEEKAQRAAVKIMFPTLLCIFPAIFVVILGPAAYQIAEMFSRMQ